MNELAICLLRDQCKRDTVWCWPCGMVGASSQAVSAVVISGAGELPMCRECLGSRLAHPLENDVGTVPVVQPEWVTLFRRLDDENRAAKAKRLEET